jgi:ParB/Sulfiredoxin domain/Protein of unknown function (DUF3102)
MTKKRPPTLRKLAAEIEAEHARSIEGFRHGVRHALKCGRLLLAVKDRLPHGEFLSWLKTNVRVKRRACSNYMRLARWANEHPNANLEDERSITRALRIISRPRRKLPKFRGQAELVEVSALKAHPRSFRKHPPEQIAHLILSITEHGFYQPVVTARDLTILAGHGVVQAARMMRRSHVPVRRLDLDPNERRALEILLGDNELRETAERDDHRFVDLVEKLRRGSTLLGTGLDDAKFEALRQAAFGPRKR